MPGPGRRGADKKQITASRLFGQPVLTTDELQESVSNYMSRAAEKLRRQHSVCEAIQVFVQTNRYSNAVVVPIPNTSGDTRLLARRHCSGSNKPTDLAIVMRRRA